MLVVLAHYVEIAPSCGETIIAGLLVVVAASRVGSMLSCREELVLSGRLILCLQASAVITLAVLGHIAIG